MCSQIKFCRKIVLDTPSATNLVTMTPLLSASAVDGCKRKLEDASLKIGSLCTANRMKYWEFFQWVFSSLSNSVYFFILLKWQDLSLDYYESHFLWKVSTLLYLHFVAAKNLGICGISALLHVFMFFRFTTS